MMRGQLALLAIAAALAACATTPSDPGDPVLFVAEQAPSSLSLPLLGTVVHAGPQLVRSPFAWAPIVWLAPDGADVVAGETVLRYDADIIARWTEGDRLTVDRLRADAALRRERGRKRLADLAARRSDLKRRRLVVEAALASEGRREADELTLLRLELAAAERRHSRLAARQAALAELAGAGLTAAETLARAREDRDLAMAALVPLRATEQLLAAAGLTLEARRRQLELARLELQLAEGTDDGALAAEMSVARARLEREEEVGRRDLLMREARLATREDLVAEPGLVAPVAGVQRPRRGVQPGSKVRGVTALVLDDEGLLVEVLVPERWRDLVRLWRPETPTEGRVRVQLPALGPMSQPGRLVAIADAASGPDDGVGRNYRAQVLLDAIPQGLRAGMAAQVAVELPLPSEAVLVPPWCLDGSEPPQVMLADGSQRSVRALRIHEVMVVTSGLEPGTLLRAVERPEARQQAGFAGTVEAERSIVVEIEGWAWQIETVLPPGAPVVAGQEIARLVNDRHDPDEAAMRIDHGEAEAAANRAIAEEAAAFTLARARRDARLASLDAQRARLDHLALRFASTAEAERSAALSQARAEVSLARAQRRALLVADPSTSSAREREQAEIAVAAAAAAQRSAALDVVSARRQQDLLRLLNAAESERRALATAGLARTRATLALRRHGLEVARAQRNERSALSRLDNQRRWRDGTVLHAPVSGRLQHLRSGGWSPGDRLGGRHSRNPFEIPQGLGRRVAIEVPARRAATLLRGETVRVQVPVAGDKELGGRIAHIASFHRRAADGNGGRLGGGEPLVDVVVAFAVPSALAEVVAPGVSVRVLLLEEHE